MNQARRNMPPATPPQWGHAPTTQMPRVSYAPQHAPVRARMPDYQQYAAPQQQALYPWAYGTIAPVAPVAPVKPKRKRHVFLWVFLGVQVLFLVWMIAGAAGTSGTGASAHTQAVTFCADKSNWQYLYKSQADCVTHYGNTLNGASDLGKGIGFAVILGVWVASDFLLGVGYLVYRLARRP